ncbi:hypothetical protein [Bacillus marinisedimentorum]|uniref:hypothetical protein n=1 Tax=Bacillus marinisedimentorum TaxID=1821260 RepID=UPI00147164D6|nr:hypothetical protein [Bacillus marinisedimentorum]
MLGVVLAGIAVLVILFSIEMTPDEDEEEKVIARAEEYLETNDEHANYEIYDVLYDNMGNYGKFEYAAKVRDVNSGVEFLVFYNDDTGKMEDSLTSELY